MSGDIIERVARAIYAADQMSRPWNEATERNKEWFRTLARAAIAAMPGYKA